MESCAVGARAMWRPRILGAGPSPTLGNDRGLQRRWHWRLATIAADTGIPCAEVDGWLQPAVAPNVAGCRSLTRKGNDRVRWSGR
jgi:hypothetical protein